MTEQVKASELYSKAAEFGLTVEQKTISNMEVDYITVPDPLIRVILQEVQLHKEVQEEAIDKMVERTVDYFQLEPKEQVRKIETTLVIETVIEFLRLTSFIKDGIDMVEAGISDEGSVVVTAYYVGQNELTKKVFDGEMSEAEVNEMEKQINILDGSINIYEEAKKRLAEKQNNVIPFQNREQRRIAKKRGAVK